MVEEEQAFLAVGEKSGNRLFTNGAIRILILRIICIDSPSTGVVLMRTRNSKVLELRNENVAKVFGLRVNFYGYGLQLEAVEVNVTLQGIRHLYQPQ